MPEDVRARGAAEAGWAVAGEDGELWAVGDEQLLEGDWQTASSSEGPGSEGPGDREAAEEWQSSQEWGGDWEMPLGEELPVDEEMSVDDGSLVDDELPLDDGSLVDGDVDDMGRRQERTTGRRRPALRVLGALLVVIVVIGVVAFVRVSDDIDPGGRLGRTVTVHIPRGSSTLAIGRLLAKAGVIHGVDVFGLYVKLEGDGPLYPGTYRLATNEPYSKAVAALEAGPPVLTEKLVVPEGYTVAQMARAAARLKGIGITVAAFEAAARNGQVSSPYLPAGKTNLEGLLFPATYPVQVGEGADTLVQYMAQTFEQNAEALGLVPGKPVAVRSPYSPAKLHFSPYQVVEVASIVEREAKFNSDRGRIASVIYNRLARGMPIGAESTLLYGLGEPAGGANMNDEIPNPYNTLLHAGLPPTPISSPGIPSLRAALHPPATTYLYWVEVNPDGKMGFASTNAGFKQLQRECRAVKLC